MRYSEKLIFNQQDCKIIKKVTSETSKHKHYYILQTPFGLCKLRTDRWVLGRIPTILAAINPTEFFINQAKEVHGDKYDYSYVDYKNSSTKVKIICKDHGVFEQTPHGHLLGKKCSKCRHDKLAQLLIGSKEKLQYKSNIVHNNEYEIIGEYIKADIKIKIKHLKCSRIIEQTPASHIQGNSCPFCSYSSGWSYSNWEKTAKNSKSFDSYKVYVIYCFNKDNNESFIKVGRTFNKIENRLRKNTKKFPYDFKIIKEIIFKNAIDCCEYERELLNKFAINSYEPLKHFNGKYECFDSNILVNIEDYLKEKEFSHSEIA